MQVFQSIGKVLSQNFRVVYFNQTQAAAPDSFDNLTCFSWMPFGGTMSPVALVPLPKWAHVGKGAYWLAKEYRLYVLGG
jgi:hypothetical protein